MSDSKEKQGTGQEIPDGNLDPEVVEPNMTLNTETQDQTNENQNISAVPETEEKSNSNPDAVVKSETVDESNVKPDVSVETETVDKNNTSQNISAETEIGTTIEDKNNASQNVSVEIEVEDKSSPNQVISAAIENGDTSNATQEEAPNEVKNENENDRSPPKLGQEDEITDAVEVPQNLETKTLEDEVLETETHVDPPISVAPVLSVKVQAENGSDDDEDRRINENGNDNNGSLGLKNPFLLDDYDMHEGGESGTEDDQSNFMKELESFFKERSMEFKPPKFYGEGLNCLKLWRAVTRLGGYDKVTSCKLWRQVGESFKPPKTCTTVSWTFRGFYEKALLDYERHKINGGELALNVSSPVEPMSVDAQASGSGRARRYAAARAMQGWHSQRLLGNGEVGDPIIKDKNALPGQKREKQLKSIGIGLLKRKKPSYTDDLVKALRPKTLKLQLDTAVVDVGPPADWVKINVQRTKDCFEIYALVPGLLREEVRVQSDPAGRLVISGEPEQLDNPWGVTPFKKVVNLPSRIDPQQSSAVVTLHGQLFVRVPFEHSD